MINYRSKALLKREIRQQIFTKKFLIMTLSFPVVMVLIIALQAFIVTYDREGRSTLHVLTESDAFQSLIINQFAESEFADDSLFEIHHERINDSGELEAYIAGHRQALLDGSITGVVFIPDSAHDDKRIAYYSSNPGNQNMQGRLREHVNRAVVGEYFRALNIDRSAIEYARTNVAIDGVRVTETGTTGAGPGNMIVAGVFTFLVYISLLMMGPMVMGAVNEEKTNRVVEVLLSSVTPQELMYSKIVGTAITGLVQMAIWIAPVALIAMGALPMILTMDLGIQLDGFSLAYFLLNYFFGLLIFLSIFAAFGAMFDTPQDAQQAMTPVIFMIIIPFLLAMTMARNPANTLAEVSSMLPFATLLVMPARMTLIDVPAWQLLIAVVVNILTFYYSIRFGAKIYRVTILMTGKRPGWKEIYKWLRYE